MTSDGRTGGKTDRTSVSVFELPGGFFDDACLLRDGRFDSRDDADPRSRVREGVTALSGLSAKAEDGRSSVFGGSMSRWSCNACKSEFESLEEQRTHFKSDFHRFNVKLILAGKATISEDDFDELGRESSLLDDYEISSISGSDDESDHDSRLNLGASDGLAKGMLDAKRKLVFTLLSGKIVSVWKCLLLSDLEDLVLENDSGNSEVNDHCYPRLREADVLKRLKDLVGEPRDRMHLRIVLLASGGHFAGCVFDGNSVIAHKTFHRYVVRAKSGKRQSAKDATGKAANSAGSSLRRYNEAALKRDISELLVTWKPYFAASSCIFLHAPSSNRQLFFEGEKPIFSSHLAVIRHVPLTVRRPTFKEAKHVYNLLTCISHEEVQTNHLSSLKREASVDATITETMIQDLIELQLENHSELENRQPAEDLDVCKSKGMSNEYNMVDVSCLQVSENKITPLHKAAKLGDAQKTLEFLEQGMDPCLKDGGGRTPYMLASDKEVRNTFRRFMASNMDKWDWRAANVPSPLTKELEESQAVKQAEKDAKRKAKSKELKKLRKTKEKAQAQSAASRDSSTASGSSLAVATSSNQGRQNSQIPGVTEEEKRRAALNAEREKRAAAAERRIAEAQNRVTETHAARSEPMNDMQCSCCMSSLSGKVPFHRYHYKYCSSSCMHVHREMMEDG